MRLAQEKHWVGTQVNSLEDFSFDNHVTTSTNDVVAVLYDNKESESFQPIWAEFARASVGTPVTVAAVDCRVRSKVCLRSHITELHRYAGPRITFFSMNGTVEPMAFDGTPTVANLLAFTKDFQADMQFRVTVPEETSGSEHVHLLHGDQFQRFIRNSEFSAVNFFHPYSPFSASFDPHWKAFARASGNWNLNLPVGEVNCQEDKLLCDRFKIHSFPSVRFFGDGGEASYRDRDRRSVRGLVQYASDLIGDERMVVQDPIMSTSISHDDEAPAPPGSPPSVQTMRDERVSLNRQLAHLDHLWITPLSGLLERLSHPGLGTKNKNNKRKGSNKRRGRRGRGGGGGGRRGGGGGRGRNRKPHGVSRGPSSSSIAEGPEEAGAEPEPRLTDEQRFLYRLQIDRLEQSGAAPRFEVDPYFWMDNHYLLPGSRDEGDGAVKRASSLQHQKICLSDAASYCGARADGQDLNLELRGGRLLAMLLARPDVDANSTDTPQSEEEMMMMGAANDEMWMERRDILNDVMWMEERAQLDAIGVEGVRREDVEENWRSMRDELDRMWKEDPHNEELFDMWMDGRKREEFYEVWLDNANIRPAAPGMVQVNDLIREHLNEELPYKAMSGWTKELFLERMVMSNREKLDEIKAKRKQVDAFIELATNRGQTERLVDRLLRQGEFETFLQGGKRAPPMKLGFGSSAADVCMVKRIGSLSPACANNVLDTIELFEEFPDYASAEINNPSSRGSRTIVDGFLNLFRAPPQHHHQPGADHHLAHGVGRGGGRSGDGHMNPTAFSFGCRRTEVGNSCLVGVALSLQLLVALLFVVVLALKAFKSAPWRTWGRRTAAARARPPSSSPSPSPPTPVVLGTTSASPTTTSTTSTCTTTTTTTAWRRFLPGGYLGSTRVRNILLLPADDDSDSSSLRVALTGTDPAAAATAVTGVSLDPASPSAHQRGTYQPPTRAHVV